MDKSQNSFEFPSSHLQDAVNALWEKLHEVNGTINFLIERNKELKEKLDSDGVFSKEDVAKMKDLERGIENLELENDEYLGRISKLELHIVDINSDLDKLGIYRKLYENLVAAYNQLKSELKNRDASEEESKQLEKSLADIAELEENLIILRKELDNKNHQLASSTEEIIRFKNIIEENEKNRNNYSDAKSEIDKLNDVIDTLAASRDALREESDNLKFEIERIKSSDNVELAKLKKEVAQLAEDKSAFEKDIETLSNEFNTVKTEKVNLEKRLEEEKQKSESQQSEVLELRSQVDALNVQLAGTAAFIKKIEMKDIEISELNREIEGLKSEIIILQNRINDSKTEQENLFADYQEAVKSIEELKELAEQLRAEEKNTPNAEEFEQLQSDLEVKQKMISEFAQSEKDLLIKIQNLEHEIEEKQKHVRTADELRVEYEEKQKSLEGILVEKDNRTDELININKNLMEKVESLENIANESTDISQRLKELKSDYDEQLNKIRTERDGAEKELALKSQSIKVLETQIAHLQQKIREIEISQIKSDEKLSLEEALRENLIANLEKQQHRLGELIKKT